MSSGRRDSHLDRRRFFKSAGASVAAGAALTFGASVGAASGIRQGRVLTEKERLLRIASCSYPLRQLFKSRPGGRGGRSGGAGEGGGAGVAAAAGTPAAGRGGGAGGR